MRSSTWAAVAGCLATIDLLLPGCTPPVELDCGAGEPQHVGHTWACVYTDAAPAT